MVWRSERSEDDRGGQAQLDGKRSVMNTATKRSDKAISKDQKNVNVEKREETIAGRQEEWWWWRW